MLRESKGVRGLGVVVIFLCVSSGSGSSGGSLDGGMTGDPPPWDGLPVLTSSTVTEGALADDSCSTGNFPPQWEWNAGQTVTSPAAATSGTPQVRQYRGGQLIATYATLGSGDDQCQPTENSSQNPVVACGPFNSRPFRNWQDGDVFEVSPAVYSGVANQPYIGPGIDTHAEFDAGQWHIPKNIVIRGITVDGKRPVIVLDGEGVSIHTLGQAPVYIAQSENLTIENIDIACTAEVSVKAGVYINGGKNVTLRDMRIHGFRIARGNGIIGSNEGNAGELWLDRLELFDNGGDSGPEHNVYIGESDVDPDFTVRMTNSWSHDAFYGHTFKSRAQVNILEGNYFQGGRPVAGESQAEAYLVDIPNGGRLSMRNNILAKDASGDNSNGASITFGVEGILDERPLGITIENNTFVAFAHYFDSQMHPLLPFVFFYPPQVPGDPDFLVSPTELAVRRNVFAGYCGLEEPFAAYRGDLALTVGMSELNEDYSLKNRYVSEDLSILGTAAYRHAAQGGGTREMPTIGAVD
jgi:hypothetical protein